MLNQVELDSQVFPKFVSALEASGSWTSTVVCELKQILESFCKEIVVGSGDSGATNIEEGGCDLFCLYTQTVKSKQRLSLLCKEACPNYL